MLDEVTFWVDDLTETDRGKDFQCQMCKGSLIVMIPKTNIVNHMRNTSDGILLNI